MRDRILARIQDLKAEFETGQKAIAALEEQQATLQTTLIRISGAIQVLEELLNELDAMPEIPPIEISSTDADPAISES